MLYFAYGSNLNWKQMLKERCPGAKFICKYQLKGYKLIFSSYDSGRVYGHANIVIQNKSKTPGAVWNITKKNEKVLDWYEGVPYYYQKKYLRWKGKKMLVYIQKNFVKKKPSLEYIQTIVDGYKDCKLDLSYLKKRISYFPINYDIKW